MLVFFASIILVVTTIVRSAPENLSGLYQLDSCSCTTLRCPQTSPYHFDQTQNGDITISYFNIPAARGRASTNSAGQTQVSFEWLPGFDFDTNCTGLWSPVRQSIELKCGSQQRQCTGWFKCNSGQCTRSTAAANIRAVSNWWIWTILPLISLFL